MQDCARLAGFFAAHAVWSVSDTSGLTPLLGTDGPDGGRKMIRFALDDLEDAAQAGKDALAGNREGALRAVLVTDAYLRLSGDRMDALVVEAVDYGPPGRSMTIGIPYRPHDDPAGFAVHRPKVLELNGVGEAELNGLLTAFFAGVDTHEQGAGVWNAHLDESV